MKKENDSVKLIVIITACVLLVVSVVIFGFYNYSARSTIVIDGEGEVEIMPDLVSINFEIKTTADTTAEAKQENDNITNTVIEALIAEGIDREDIQTRNLYVSEEYDWSSSTRKLVGYTASHNLIVEISTEDTDLISNVVNAGVNSGSTLSYISYSLSNELENEINAQAVAIATADAKEKAKAMANNLDLRLGRIVQISEGSLNSGIYYAKTMSAIEYDSASGNIQPESQTQTATVSIVFEIK